MEQIHKIKNDRIRSRRAVAPIIATLLMIAIAVIGGVMIYVFTQGFFGNSSITTSPSVDSITMSGYDMREITASATTGVSQHESVTAVQAGSTGTAGILGTGEEGAIYIKNVGQKSYTISKLEVNGRLMVFQSTYAPNTSADGDWGILTVPDTKTLTAGGALADYRTAPTILPGQEGTLIVTFDSTGTDDNSAATGRTVPVKLTSASGSVYNFNVVIGSKL